MKTPTELGMTLECSTPLGGVDGDWPHIAYSCRLVRNGREVWAGPFRLGIGHVRLPKSGSAELMRLEMSREEESMLAAMNSRPHANFRNKDLQASLCAKLAKAQNVRPDCEQVVSSLVMDGSAYFDGSRFEDWCADLGYSEDSRKALATFEACQEIGRALTRALSRQELDKLREWAQTV